MFFMILFFCSIENMAGNNSIKELYRDPLYPIPGPPYPRTLYSQVPTRTSPQVLDPRVSLQAPTPGLHSQGPTPGHPPLHWRLIPTHDSNGTEIMIIRHAFYESEQFFGNIYSLCLSKTGVI